jgi:hypothetical protein
LEALTFLRGRQEEDRMITVQSMTQWLPLGEFVVNVIIAIATVIALLLVYREFKEMKFQSISLERSIQASTYQALLDSERALTDKMSEKEDFLQEYFASLDLDIPNVPPDHIRLLSATTAFNENLYFQSERGAIPASVWPAWRRFLKDLYSGPLMRCVWPYIKHWYYDSFVEYIDQLIAEHDAEQAQPKVSHEA